MSLATRMIKKYSCHYSCRYIKLKNDLNALLISDLTVDEYSSEASEEEEIMSSETDDEGPGKDSSPEGDTEGYEGGGEDEGETSDGAGEIDTREREQRVNDLEEFEELVKKEDAKKMGSTEKQVPYEAI